MSARFSFDSSAFRRALTGRVARHLEEEAMDHLERQVIKIRNEAVKNTKVVTGNLRAGWKWDRGSDGQGEYVRIYNPVRYAAAYEYGTKHMTGRRPLRRAITTVTGIQGLSGIFRNRGA